MSDASMLSCRFYENKLPSVDEVVMARVISIADLGAYVHLLEYNNIEGMLMLSELSRRRIRSVNKLLRVGRMECVSVTRVDKVKNYIDLSKRRVTPQEAMECQERYSKAKCINSIIRRVAEMMEYSKIEELEELYRKTAWHFDRKCQKKARCFEVFKMAVTDSSVLEECNLDADIHEALVSVIKAKIPQVITKLRATLEVTCFEYEGIDAIKAALLAGKACSTKDIAIRINLIAPPVYVMTVMIQDHVEGIKLMEHAMAVIEEKIKSFKGTFKLLTSPQVVSDRDELEMVDMLEKLQMENIEVSGDEDSSDDDLNTFMFETLT